MPRAGWRRCTIPTMSPRCWRRGCRAEKERRIGFPVTPTVARRAQAVPGGTCLAARLALAHGFAANTAGGSHHALADTGAGYCVFNDLAMAAVRLVEEGTVARVLIVDCDVHQGDGTAALLAGRPGIATYSIHAEKNFPVRKARSTLDVPLADGVGDEEYLDDAGGDAGAAARRRSARAGAVSGGRRSVRGRSAGAVGADARGAGAA